MDAEFVNVYINKQKALIDDLQSKLLLAETKVEVLSNQLAVFKAEAESNKAAKKEPKS